MDLSNLSMVFNLLVWGGIFIGLLVQLVLSIRLVPTKSAFVVERLGRYHRTLGPGFHALFPFIDKVAYIRNLKETTVDVPPQLCFTKDNVKVIVDGVMYMTVVEPQKASYGVTDYYRAATELAQTTTRSVVGLLDLDRTFEERAHISSRVVAVLNAAGEAWGVNVLRYEIKNISPPASVQAAMEKQVVAERQKRALVAESEGQMQSKINRSEGVKAEMINLSDGERQRSINEAEGKASEILEIAKATALSIEQIGQALSGEHGSESLYLQLGLKYLQSFAQIAKAENKVVIPADLTDMKTLLAQFVALKPEAR
ncbi:MAG: stomatin-like protein [bacterium]|nr:stomatin-like protein [bacterium]